VHTYYPHFLPESAEIQLPASARTCQTSPMFWRADGTMVAVVTPEKVAVGSQPQQSGCVAVGFDLNEPYDGTGQIFSPSVSAVVFDQDGGTSIGGVTYKEPSPNACTYEPQSNTGITIVRHLLGPPGAPLNSPVYYQIYSIVNSGVMP